MLHIIKDIQVIHRLFFGRATKGHFTYTMNVSENVRTNKQVKAPIVEMHNKNH